jgi:single-strand DNA-binding protein
MTYTGTVIYVGQTNQVSDKFAVREIVLSDETEKYPQEVKFQTTQKNCALLDNISVGDKVTAHYNLRGKRYERNGTTSWFSTIEIWKIHPANTSTKLPAADYSKAFDDETPF